MLWILLPQQSWVEETPTCFILHVINEYFSGLEKRDRMKIIRAIEEGDATSKICSMLTFLLEWTLRDANAIRCNVSNRWQKFINHLDNLFLSETVLFVENDQVITWNSTDHIQEFTRNGWEDETKHLTKSIDKNVPLPYSFSFYIFCVCVCLFVFVWFVQLWLSRIVYCVLSIYSTRVSSVCAIHIQFIILIYDRARSESI